MKDKNGKPTIIFWFFLFVVLATLAIMFVQASDCEKNGEKPVCVVLTGGHSLK